MGVRQITERQPTRTGRPTNPDRQSAPTPARVYRTLKAAIGDEQVPGVRSNVIYSKYVMTGIIIQIVGHAGGGITMVVVHFWKRHV